MTKGSYIIPYGGELDGGHFPAIPPSFLSLFSLSFSETHTKIHTKYKDIYHETVFR